MNGSVPGWDAETIVGILQKRGALRAARRRVQLETSDGMMRDSKKDDAAKGDKSDVERVAARIQACMLERRRCERTGHCSIEDVAIDRIARARDLWDESLCEELSLLFAERARKTADSNAGTGVTFLFDSEDLLDVLLRIEGAENMSPPAKAAMQSRKMPVHFAPTCQSDILRNLARLHPRWHHLGVDDKAPFFPEFVDDEEGSSAPLPGAPDDEPTAEMIFERYAAVAASGCVSETEELSSRGVFPGMRKEYWGRLLGVRSSDEVRAAYFEQLLASAGPTRLLIDDLLAIDVDHSVNCAAYFLFKDTLHDVMRAFGRDPWTSSHKVAGPLLESLCKRVFDLTPGSVDSRHVRAALGPSSVQPFRGLVLYAAPLCYACSKAEDVYFLFRQMYALYWCRLSAIDDYRGTIISLCSTFEHLVSAALPQVASHLQSLGVSPLHIAFPWIHLAFSGYLEIEQLLLLWDRIVSFNTLDILPLAAAAIFRRHADALMNADDAKSARNVLMSPQARSVNIIELLQGDLFAGFDATNAAFV